MKQRHDGTLMQFACFALERTNGSQQAMWHRASNHGGGKIITGDPRVRHHARSLESYHQILLQHLRKTFNSSTEPRKYQCAHCAADFDTSGWCTRHWLDKHAPADFDKTNYKTAKQRRPLLTKAIEMSTGAN
jgi:hypothetical protein